MARKANSCALCENSNLPSICVSCVNYRANNYYATLKILRETCDCMYVKLSGKLVVKRKADEQRNWRILQNEKLAQLREKLHFMEIQLAKGRATAEKRSQELRARFELLDSSRLKLESNHVELLGKFYPNLICTQSLGHMAITTELLHKQSVVIKQVCRLFPQRRVSVEGDKRDGSIGCQYDQICNARLPRGLDPHSVPSEELAASLGVPAHAYGKEIRTGMLVQLPEAMSIPFSFHVKTLAQPVEIIHGPIEVLVTLVLHQWNQKENHSWMVQETVASIILMPLHIRWKHTGNCRKGFLFSRRVWHVLQLTAIIHCIWIFPLKCQHLKPLQSCCTLYLQQKKSDLSFLQGWHAQDLLSKFSL